MQHHLRLGQLSGHLWIGKLRFDLRLELPRNMRSKLRQDHLSHVRSRDSEGGYGRILARLGAAFRVRDPWLLVGTEVLRQGWKLHLSSIPIEAASVIQLVVPRLLARGVSFKCARDANVLIRLNCGELGDTQIGKFLTVYSRSDQEARELAHELVPLTDGHVGPRVPSDAHLGGLVYTRYGGMNPLIVENRLGLKILTILDTDGRPIPDAYAVPYVPDPAKWPFVESCPQSLGSAPAPIIGPGYRIVSVIATKPTGSVFLAIDLRSREKLSLVVLKRAVPFTHSDLHGRDAGDRLKNEARALERLAGITGVPGYRDFFTYEGETYLVIDHVEGRSLHAACSDLRQGNAFAELKHEARKELISRVASVTGIVRQVHRRGYVHRDVSANNVLVSAQRSVSLLDFELAWLLGDRDPPFQTGTLGFMSPQQQRRRAAPTTSDDVFGIGALAFFALTSIDPALLLGLTSRQRERLIEELLGERSIISASVARCMHALPRMRPSLAEFECSLLATIERPDWPKHAPKPPQSTSPTRSSEPTICSAVRGLNGHVLTEPDSGLWLSESVYVRGVASSYELSLNAHQGIAGVVYLISRLAGAGFDVSPVLQRFHAAVAALTKAISADRMSLPGLYFGRMGMAVALLEAVRAGLIAPPSAAILAACRSDRFDWPDLTHGVAGQGVGGLTCFAVTSDSAWLVYAASCMEHLLSTQREDGTWELPEGVDGMSGDVLTGFAHGTAGILYFLAQYHNRFPDRRVLQAIYRAEQALLSLGSTIESGARVWPYSLKQTAPWLWWCHGSPGIALSYLTLFETTRDETYARVARDALRAIPELVSSANLSQCHGLAGLGEIYLEAARVLDEPIWKVRADRISAILIASARRKRGGTVWPVEKTGVYTADLMVGCAGIIHFLARNAIKPPGWGPPLLPGPAGL